MKDAKMLYEEKDVQRELRAVVFAVTHDAQITDDLYGDALAHLWLVESEHPGQTQSWYLQNCRRFAKDHAKAGRSIDSRKRICNSTELTPDLRTAEDTFRNVSARDTLTELRLRLDPMNRAILNHIMLGETDTELARNFALSRKAIRKRRIRIKATARALLIES
jgi:DNA-directed RNA polymerase specialized sigma24 family protein